MSNATPTGLNDSQTRAIELAKRNGDYIAAGANVIGGCLYRVNARTLDVLVRKGLAEHAFGPDGGYSVRLKSAAK